MSPGPRANLRFLPEPRPSGSQVHHRPRHVGVSPLVGAHAVAMREAKEIGDALSIDEILGIHPWSHDFQSTGVDNHRALRVVYGSRQLESAPAVREHPGAWPRPTRRSRHDALYACALALFSE